VLVPDFAAVVLAGGAARRLNRATKPMLPVGGRPMLDRVLDAVAAADPRVVVGPDDLRLPAGVTRTCERPAGGGPVAALAAGLALVPRSTRYVAVLGADLPFLTAADVQLLLAAVGAQDGATFVDGRGRAQWLCGVWRPAALVDRLADVGDPAGLALRALVSGLRVQAVDPGELTGPAPWYDCDTEDDLVAARRWADDGPDATRVNRETP
jgi:molybdopterin-guanine dinucleotide biosynthesis protein A